MKSVVTMIKTNLTENFSFQETDKNSKIKNINSKIESHPITNKNIKQK